MKHRSSPECVGLFFPVQCVRANPFYTPDVKPEDGDITAHGTASAIESHENDDHVSFQVTANLLTSEEGNMRPYALEMEAYGVFRCPKTAWEGMERESMEVQGIQILMGAMRERIATITSRGPWGPMFVPVVRFSLKSPSNDNVKE